MLDVPANAMDLFPTLSEIIDAPMPTDRVYDGVSLLPLLDGKLIVRKPDEPFFYYNCENLQAVRLGDWKLHLPHQKKQVPFWDKNREFFNIAKPVLYNLSVDEGETTDVAAKHPEVVQQMLTLAGEMRGELGEYLQRGKGQRPTGSAIHGAPIVSHEKDWRRLVDPAMDAAITKERLKRYPEFKAGKMKGRGSVKRR